MVTDAFTVYKGYRIHLLEEADYQKDVEGRYVVFVVIAKLDGSKQVYHRVPDCFGQNLAEAQALSMHHGMRLVDDGELH